MFKSTILCHALIFLFTLVSMAEETKSSDTSPHKKDHIVIDFSDFGNKDIWELKLRRGKNDTKVILDNTLKDNVLRLRSNRASYYFQKSVNVNINKHGIFEFKWKVKKHPKNGDTRSGSTDDQAGQVLLAFEGNNLISYIWDCNAPVGYSKDASIPFILSQKILVVQTGDNKKDNDKWFTITRDINADYKKLYGRKAPKLAGVAIQINSQHTKSFAEAHISPLKFKKK